MSRRKEPTIPAELLDQLLAGSDAASALDQGGSLDSLKKALAERPLNAEMDYHLGGDEQAGNSRNGYGRKCAITDGEHRAVPGAREDAQRWKKLPHGSNGRSTRPIHWCFSTPFASRSAMKAWSAVEQASDGPAVNPIHIALGVRADGRKEVLGLWIEQNEGAKFWLRVMNELKNRGTEDIMLAVVDGLKGFPDAITAVFPEAVVQTCIVHLLRNSMDFVSWKDRKPLATALKAIYRAVDAKAAEDALIAFEASEWGLRYVAIARSWRRAWNEVIPFFAFPEAVRKIIYTTNAIEALN